MWFRHKGSHLFPTRNIGLNFMIWQSSSSQGIPQSLFRPCCRAMGRPLRFSQTSVSVVTAVLQTKSMPCGLWNSREAFSVAETTLFCGPPHADVPPRILQSSSSCSQLVKNGEFWRTPCGRKGHDKSQAKYMASEAEGRLGEFEGYAPQ